MILMSFGKFNDILKIYWILFIYKFYGLKGDGYIYIGFRK